MYFELSKSGNPFFSRMHPLLAGMLQAAALDPWERYPDGSGRLLPAPGDEEELCRDWHDFVQPGLRRHFDSERVIIAEDITLLKEGRGKTSLWSLEIPRSHCEAWLTTLNAQRLALATEYLFTEKELTEKEALDLSSERGIALMQVNFFAFVQECLVQVVMSEDLHSETNQTTEND
jgi:hypothetical protein